MALAGVVVGVALDRVLLRPRVSERIDQVSSEQSPDTASALATIQSEIQHLSFALQERNALQRDPASLREHPVPPTKDLDRLTSAVEALNQLLRDQSPGPGSHTVSARRALDEAKGPGYPSLEAMQQRVQVLYREDEKNSFYPVQVELTKAHLLWNRDDIIERYGAPESCWPDNLGLAMKYAGPQFSQTKWTIKFILNNDFLIEVHLQGD